jgi:ferredoxin
MHRNFNRKMGMGRGRGLGMGRGMGAGRAGAYPQEIYPDPSGFQPPSTESMSPEQKIAMMKEQTKTLEAQLQEINARINALEKDRDVLMMTAEVNTEKCIGCLRCSSVCPTGAISMFEGTAKIDRSKCTGCGQCIPLCPEGAIVLKEARS